MSDHLARLEHKLDTDAAERKRLTLEDLKIQVEGALASFEAGNYATARAELNGAKFIIDGHERRERGG